MACSRVTGGSRPGSSLRSGGPGAQNFMTYRFVPRPDCRTGCTSTGSSPYRSDPPVGPEGPAHREGVPKAQGRVPRPVQRDEATLLRDAALGAALGSAIQAAGRLTLRSSRPRVPRQPNEAHHLGGRRGWAVPGLPRWPAVGQRGAQDGSHLSPGSVQRAPPWGTAGSALGRSGPCTRLPDCGSTGTW